jgi:hypothetical protein
MVASALSLMFSGLVGRKSVSAGGRTMGEVGHDDMNTPGLVRPLDWTDPGRIGEPGREIDPEKGNVSPGEVQGRGRCGTSLSVKNAHGIKVHESQSLFVFVCSFREEANGEGGGLPNASDSSGSSAGALLDRIAAEPPFTLDKGSPFRMNLLDPLLILRPLGDPVFRFSFRFTP